MNTSAPEIHLQGKVAVVTGASRGIGEAIAKSFARSGAKVVLSARKPEGVERVAAEIRAAGGEAVGVVAHNGKRDDVRALIERAAKEYGKVDVLVNNAATNPHFGPFMSIDEGAWDKTFEVNVKGYFEATRAFVEHVTGRDGKGSVVNVASIQGLGAAVAQGVYAMTKASVLSMTKTLAHELGPSGIRVNAVAPGLVRTRFASALTDNDDIAKGWVARTPLGRIAEPEEIAPAVLYLASDASSYVNGHTLVIDGGYTAD